ncbi:MAG: 16S rRNA (guanine(966)-N(2))-methyltransferase RsmD [Bacilli bacterium]|nr:16S rRNA (guanine(966)-N(2))-methyltransferase RsmD [Bacilli bacterium]
MKVISGIYKGRILEGFSIEGTRPTMDRVKESLFGMIQNHLSDSVVLDLFAGSGALAIEALSQGAKKAYLVDTNNQSIKTINKNVEKLQIKNASIIKSDYTKALEKFYNQNLKFDIIFIDPPYKTDYIAKSLDLINKYNLLSDDGIIVCESNELEKVIYPKTCKISKMKKYGDKLIVLLEKL